VFLPEFAGWTAARCQPAQQAIQEGRRRVDKEPIARVAPRFRPFAHAFHPALQTRFRGPVRTHATEPTAVERSGGLT